MSPRPCTADAGPAHPWSCGLRVLLCRRVPGPGAGPAVAQGRGPCCHLRAGGSHQGAGNAKPEQALAEEPHRAGLVHAERGTKTDVAEQDPGSKEGALNHGLDPALWECWCLRLVPGAQRCVLSPTAQHRTALCDQHLSPAIKQAVSEELSSASGVCPRGTMLTPGNLAGGEGGRVQGRLCPCSR